MVEAQRKLPLRPKRFRPRMEHFRRLEWLVMSLKAERLRLQARIEDLENAGNSAGSSGLAQ